MFFVIPRISRAVYFSFDEKEGDQVSLDTDAVAQGLRICDHLSSSHHSHPLGHYCWVPHIYDVAQHLSPHHSREHHLVLTVR